MRVLISNPDALGDFVLRQPMIAALVSEGHQPLLVVRDFVAPLARLLFPDLPLLYSPGDPYSSSFTLSSQAGELLLSRIRAFEPDLVVAASYQYTRLEEELILALPETPNLALSGPLYPGDPGEGHPLQPRIGFRDRVVVAVDAPELRKNEQLASRILGRNVNLPAPVLQLPETVRQVTNARLQRLGIERGQYWVAYVGDTSHSAIRNWGVPNWTLFLKGMLERTGVPLLFAGTPEESATVERIQESLGPLAQQTVNCSSTLDGIDGLVGLLEGGAGYVGKDTGPMHLAAALGKPVLAVFGGGYWPRFVPAASTGAVLTVTVPCSPCNYHCHVQDSWCLKTVPVEEALAAFDRILQDPSGPFEVRELPPPPLLIHRMVRESSERYLTVIRQYAQLVKDLQSSPPHAAGSVTAGTPPEPEAGSNGQPEVLQGPGPDETAVLHGRILELQAQLEEKSTEAETLGRLLPVLRDEIDQLLSTPSAPAPAGPWQAFRRKLSQGK
jgi:ADP-heptose:LPS heptosyltransferase